MHALRFLAVFAMVCGTLWTSRALADDGVANDDDKADDDDKDDDDKGDDDDKDDDDDQDDGESGQSDDDENRGPPPPRGPVRVTLRSSLDGRLGGAVGNVLLVPFATPGPGLGASLGGTFLVWDTFFTRADIAASAGYAQNGDALPLAGYEGLVAVGARMNGRYAGLSADVHLGVSSVALFPLPRTGVGGEVIVRPVAVDFDDDAGFWWDFRLRADADVLIIAPAPSASLSTGVRWWGGSTFVGARAGVAGDAIIAVVFNTVGASAFLSLESGLVF
jgi:hypothetical protein